MFSQMSTSPQCGSHTSVSSAASNDSAVQHHPLSRMRAISDAWMRSWLGEDHRHERIAVGTPRMGVAVLTRAMMEMHIQQAPAVRGMQDCLPVAHKSDAEWVGWRQKLGTWEAPKRQPLAAW